MTTLTDLEQQLAELTAKVDTARAELREHAAAQIKLIMAEYGVTAADLIDGQVTIKPAKKPLPEKYTAKAIKAAVAGKAKPKAKAKTNGAANGVTAPTNKGTRPAKYADPETGATWSGMGHAPGWIKDAKNRDKFLILTAQ
jgi:DNA-binding protein H-NS